MDGCSVISEVVSDTAYNYRVERMCVGEETEMVTFFVTGVIEAYNYGLDISMDFQQVSSCAFKSTCD